MNPVFSQPTWGRLSVLALAVTLAACGGGGVDVVNTTPLAETPSFVVDGNAVKGAMNKAKVVAYKVNADGTKGDALGNATTDAEGAYSIPVSGYTGVVLIEVTATADTTMVDEATGTTITPASGFVLRASVASPTGTGTAKTLTAQVSPLTEMAVAAAVKAGGLSTANVEKANSDLAAALGFNPTTDKPVFENGVPKSKAAITLAAISHMAKADDLAACTSATDQAAKVKCVVEELAKDGFASAGVTASLENRIVVVAEKAGADATIVPSIKQVIPAGTPPATTALDQTKAFMATLRSNAKALDASNLSLTTELQAVSDDMSGRAAPLARSTIDAFDLATKGAQFWADFQAETSPSTFSRSFYTGGYMGQYLGGCGFYQDTNYLTLATSKANAKYVACGTAGQYEYQGSATYVWSSRVRLHPGSTADNFKVYTQTRKAQVSQVWNGNYYTYSEVSPTERKHYPAAFPGSEATLTAARDSKGDIVSVQLMGEMAPSFERDYVTKWVTVPASGSQPAYSYTGGDYVYAVLGDKLKVDLGGSRTVDAAGINTVALKGSVAQYKTVNSADVLQTSMALEEGSYFKAKALSVVEVNGQPVQGGDGSHAMVLKLRFATATSALAGQLSVTDFTTDKSGTVYLPTKASFAGSAERNGVAFFKGSVAAELLNC